MKTKWKRLDKARLQRYQSMTIQTGQLEEFILFYGCKVMKGAVQ
jgi:hypothetical protein